MIILVLFWRFLGRMSPFSLSILFMLIVRYIYLYKMSIQIGDSKVSKCFAMAIVICIFFVYIAIYGYIDVIYIFFKNFQNIWLTEYLQKGHMMKFCFVSLWNSYLPSPSVQPPKKFCPSSKFWIKNETPYLVFG